jgi:pimeloyl-ACP methyl ester carboxylesterase
MLAAARAAGVRARATGGLAGDAPLVLIGSSLGAYTAALLAARDPTAALVLLAPAFEFARRFEGPFPPSERAHAATRGYYLVPHHGEKRLMRLDRAILEDGLRYEDFPAVRAPTLVLHGVRDEVVPVDLARRFAAGREPGAPTVRLVELDDDHLLHATMERIWQETAAFLAPWI